MCRIQILFWLLECSIVVFAWLPADRNLFSWQHNTTKTIDGEGVSRTAYDRKASGRSRRALPSQKIRGVNLGSLFIMEPWMAYDEWSKMGCASYPAEYECVAGIGQQAANRAFTQHWNTWITEDDLKTMNMYGLNTVRIPIGFWIKEDLLNSNEQFPQGGLAYLERICGWAADLQMYVILDLHGLPGAQKANAPFTGIAANQALFYQSDEYGRAYQFLSWMTQLVHSNRNFETVGMFEVANEPIPGQSSLTTTYYPGAVTVIRDMEAKMNVAASNALTVQFMDKRWGAGDPSMHLNQSDKNVAFDNHHYIYAKTDVQQTRAGYMNATCSGADVSDNTPLVVGEWSLAVSDSHSDQFKLTGANATAWYRQWWAAQATSYERHLGWVWWSWKTNLNDFRWDYQQAVKTGVIPLNPVEAYQISTC